MSRPLFTAALIFAAAFLPRAAYVFLTTRAGVVPFDEMQNVSIGWLRHGTLSDMYAPDTEPTAHMAPAYPLLITTVYRTLGVNTYASALTLRLLTVAAVALACALLPTLARRAGLSPSAGIIAGLFLAVVPLNTHWETAGSGEHAYTALGLVLLSLALADLHASGWSAGRTAVVAGVLAGGVALVSPATQPVIAIAVGGAWLARLAPRAQVLRASAVAALAAVLAIAPWAVRNYAAFGRFVPVRSNYPLELADGNNDRANGLTRFGVPIGAPDDFYRQIHPNENRAVRDHFYAVGEMVFMDEKGAEAKVWIAAHPGRFATLTAARFRWYWCPGAIMWDPPGGVSTLVKVVSYNLIGGLALAGIVGLFIRRHPARWLAAAVLIGPSVAYMVTHVDLRYRYATFALSALFAAEAVASLVAHSRARETVSRSDQRLPLAA